MVSRGRSDLPDLQYVSFDSILHSVGASQVRRYVELLGRGGTKIHLVTFEDDDPPDEARRAMVEAGVDWHPLPFGSHGQVGGAVRALRAWRRMRGQRLVHARSDLAAMAASFRPRQPFIWDMRGFWVDERIALGLVRSGSFAERLLRANERRLARSSRAIIVLSEAAKVEAVERYAIAPDKVVVIPTCVDLDLFRYAPVPTGPVRVLLSGTFSARYDVVAMARFILSLQRRTAAEAEVVSPDPAVSAELRRCGVDHDASSARPDQMPAVVERSSVGICFQRPDPLTAANSVPTKIAEFLATGRPVVVSPGLGDMDDILGRFRCGVVVDGFTEAALDRAADELLALLADGDLSVRCRKAAEENFSLTDAIERLQRTYKSAV
jgi:glycosyltransferase involved in cell wall biosynthesis